VDDLTASSADRPNSSDLTPGGRGQRTALGFAKAFYTFYFASGAFFSPFLVLYFSELGLDGRRIGVLRGIAPLITVVAAPLWSALADATRRHKLIRMGAIVGSWLAVLILSATRMYGALIAVVAAYAIFGAPIIPLVDNAVIALLGKEKSRYGQQRLWGAIGWGVAGLAAGVLIERYGLSMAFVGYLVLMACTGLTALAIPSVDRRHPDSGRISGQGTDLPSAQPTFVSDVRRLLLDRRWGIFLLVMLIGGLFHSTEMSYLMLYMDALGGSKTLMGIALMVGTVSEVPVWALSPYFLKRWGSRGLLAIALFAGVIQSLAYSLLTSAWGAVPLQLMHGLSFSAMWAAGVSYAADMAPEGTEATAQGMLGATLGLSSAIGALGGGLLYELQGGALVFRVTVLTSLTALILLWVGERRRSRLTAGVSAQ
jgi:MFS transporter, PPP family, 3-phenylpropionic acid transporter